MSVHLSLLQIDAVSLFLLYLVEMICSGLQIIYNTDEVNKTLQSLQMISSGHQGLRHCPVYWSDILWLIHLQQSLSIFSFRQFKKKCFLIYFSSNIACDLVCCLNLMLSTAFIAHILECICLNISNGWQLVNLHMITSTEEVIFSPVPVCLFVSRITQNCWTRNWTKFVQNLYKGWVPAQNRPH